jgi:hypothetical protein
MLGVGVFVYSVGDWAELTAGGGSLMKSEKDDAVFVVVEDGVIGLCCQYCLLCLSAYLANNNQLTITEESDRKQHD